MKKNKFNAYLMIALLASACSTTLPPEHHEVFQFPPADVYVELPIGAHLGRPVKPMGWVRTRQHWPTMEQSPNNLALCRNYYNKAARELLKEAKKVGADAVIQVRSVVLLFTGQTQEYPTAECSDDGAEGEILLRGVAVKYLPMPTPTPTPGSTPVPVATPQPTSAH